MSRYSVKTWDIDRHTFTTDTAIGPGSFTKWKLRGVLRRLREVGYEGHRGDSSVYISRNEPRAVKRGAPR